MREKGPNEYLAEALIAACMANNWLCDLRGNIRSFRTVNRIIEDRLAEGWIFVHKIGDWYCFKRLKAKSKALCEEHRDG